MDRETLSIGSLGVETAELLYLNNDDKVLMLL